MEDCLKGKKDKGTVIENYLYKARKRDSYHKLSSLKIVS